MLRAHQLRCAALIGGFARTAEAQALVRSRWAHDLVAARPAVRSASPRVMRSRTAATQRDATRPRAPPGCRRWRCGPRARRWTRAAGAGPGAAAWLRARAGLRPLPHRRPLPALHRPAVVAARRRRRCAVPLVRPRGTGAALRAVRVGGGPRGGRGRAAHRRGTGPRVSRHHRGHLRRRRRGRRGPDDPALVVATPGAEPRAGAATARRCCWTAGRCWAGRICAPPRTRCGAGWPPRRWCAAAATGAWSRWSPIRRFPPCRR